MRLVKSYLMELFNQARVERQLAGYARSLRSRAVGEAIYDVDGSFGLAGVRERNEIDLEPLCLLETSPRVKASKATGRGADFLAIGPLGSGGVVRGT